MMNAQGFWKKEVNSRPTKAEKEILKSQGVNMKSRKEVLKATKELREKNKPAPVPPKPTQEELLTNILNELKKQNEPKEIQTENLVENMEETPETK